jgi:DOPA 4,5-dioxygenase
VSPITNGIRGGFDIHIYYIHTDAFQFQYAKELWERIRRDFPELRIYRLWEGPLGPHPVAMFEVNVFTPGMRILSLNLFEFLAAGHGTRLTQGTEQFGAFIPWLVIHRGPLSALVHPNTGDDERDHTQRATWLGQPLPLNTSTLPGFKQIKEKIAQVQAEKL